MTRVLPLFLTLALFPAIADNLILRDVFGQAKVIVYELPDVEGRADVIHYVEGVRDDIKKKTAILNAGAHPAALREKLEGGFILYTTISDRSKLIRLATRQLG